MLTCVSREDTLVMSDSNYNHLLFNVLECAEPEANFYDHNHSYFMSHSTFFDNTIIGLASDTDSICKDR